MNKEISSRTLGTIGSFIVLLAVIGGFAWMYFSAQTTVTSDATIDAQYQKIEISSLKTQAEKLVADKQNYGSLPVSVPSSDQIGRDNPFTK